MPIVSMDNVGKLTKEQKEELIEKFTKAVVEVTQKSAKSVYVKINEYNRDSFGVGGKPLG
ncbi:MAG: tautomerase family protein [Candidatus Cloacimonadota bacterium]|nr:tautomerase family protein [Candidatus Cloacimonadota bacterium]